MLTPGLTDSAQAIELGFEELRDEIERTCGIALDDASGPLVARRLAPRLSELGLADLDEYASFLRMGPNRERELDRALSLVTIHETSFFRDEPQLDVFESVALPALIESRRHLRRLRLWSAGCATGEEAYTLAIILDRVLGPERKQWTIDILGSDLNRRCIEHAKRAIYDSTSFRAINPIVQRRYFALDGERYHLEPEIREMARFECLNLADQLAIRQQGEWDAIFCRNVLVFLSRAMHESLSRTFDEQLADDGYLFVGQQELGCLSSSRFAPDPGSALLACRKRMVASALRVAA